MSYEPFIASYEIIPIAPVKKPTGIRIHPGITSMSAIWDMDNADQYIVTVSGMKRPISLVSNTNKVYIKSGLKAATNYSLRVVGIKGDHNSQSAIQQFTTHPEPVVLTSVPGGSCNKCTSNTDCGGCTGKPFCLNDICVDCSQFPNAEGADGACQMLYGFYSGCQADGTCIQPSQTTSPSPSPSPSPPSVWKRRLSTGDILVLVGAVALPLLLLFILFVYLMYKHY